MSRDGNVMSNPKTSCRAKLIITLQMTSKTSQLLVNNQLTGTMQ